MDVPLLLSGQFLCLFAEKVPHFAGRWAKVQTNSYYSLYLFASYFFANLKKEKEEEKQDQKVREDILRNRTTLVWNKYSFML